VEPEVLGINYQEKSYDEILEEMLQTAFGLGLISNVASVLEEIRAGRRIENTVVMELSNHALVLADKYKYTLTPLHNALDMFKASGDDLEKLGLPFIGPKIPSQYAVTDIDIKVDDALDHDVIFPAGTLIQQDSKDPVIFETMEPCTLVQGTTSVRVFGQCTVPGSIGNVFKNELVKLTNPISGIYCDNPEGASGGKPKESDMEYLQRIINWRFTQKKGNLDAIEEAINSVSAVLGYYIDRYWNGTGTVKIIIDPPTDVVMTLVEGAVDRSMALDDDFTFVKVQDVLVNLSTVVNVSLDQTIPLSDVAKATIKKKVENFIKIYIEGGMNADGSIQKALPIGRDFIPFQCSKYLSNQIPEIQTVSFTYPEAPVTIQSHQRARCGTVSAVVV
jgi:hypothetical protein